MAEQTLSLYWMTPLPATALPSRESTGRDPWTSPRRRRKAGTGAHQPLAPSAPWHTRARPMCSRGEE